MAKEKIIFLKEVTMLSVNQPWDKLKSCVVGRSYTPELYEYIENPKVRNLLEKIAIETEEDYQQLIGILKKFDVDVIRTQYRLTEDGKIPKVSGCDVYEKPPMCPRDDSAMIGNRFFTPGDEMTNWKAILKNQGIKDIPEDWDAVRELKKTDRAKYTEIAKVVQTYTCNIQYPDRVIPIGREVLYNLKPVVDYVESHGNEVVRDMNINSACTLRIGKDLYFGLVHPQLQEIVYQEHVEKLFPDYRCHITSYSGHTDSVFTALCPGLIMTVGGGCWGEGVDPDQKYKDEFPGWERVHLENESWGKMRPWAEFKSKTRGRWWIEGASYEKATVEYVDSWMSHWVNYAAETVFDVNLLMIDRHNAIINSENPVVVKKLEEYGITPHIFNFRHRYFWDGGIHCITLDLDREGDREDYFPERG